MNTVPLRDLLRRVTGAPAAPAASDGELLRRFVERGDDTAFELLVWRHQRLVLALCRRLLRHEQDAEDAFQATFVVLARKANSIAKHGSLASWLYAVARRVALRARRQAARRASRENLADPRGASADPAALLSERDLGDALDAEVQRLPEKLRAAFILCGLQGKTNDEAAHELGCPVGTVVSRLARARERLRLSCTRRGLTLSAAPFAVLLERSTAAAATAPLVHATARAATSAALPAAVASLSRGVLRGMLLGRLARAGVAVFALACAVGFGVAQAGRVAVPAAAEQAQPAAQNDQDAEPLPQGAILRIGTQLLWHRGPISSIAISPDGKRLASVGPDGTIRLWDGGSGKQLREFGKPPAKAAEPAKGALPTPVFVLAFAPDGKRLAALHVGKKVRLWDAATGQEVYETLAGHPAGVSAVAFSPDGALLAAASSDSTITLWDIAKRKTVNVLEGHEGSVTALAFAADGRLVSGGADGTVRLWQPRDKTYADTIIRAHTGGVRGVAVAADGKRAASCGVDGIAVVWDVAAKKQLRRVGLGKEFTLRGVMSQVALSPDGERLSVAAPDSPVLRWEVDSGKALRTFATAPGAARRPGAAGHHAAFTPDGKRVAIASPVGRIHLWDAAAEKGLLAQPGHAGFLHRAAVSWDGGTLATCGDDRPIHLWDIATGKHLRSLEGHDGGAGMLVFARDGASLFSAPAPGGGKKAIRWDTATGKQLAEYNVDLLQAQAAITSLDDRTLAIYGGNGQVLGIGLAKGEEKWRHTTSFRGQSLALSLDGTRFVIGAAFGPALGVRHLDFASGKKVAEHLVKADPAIPAGYSANFVQVSPDGRTALAIDSAGKPVLVNVVAGGVTHTLTAGPKRSFFGPLHRAGFTAAPAAFSPDGRLVATPGPDHAVIVSEVATAKERLRFAGHGEALHAVTFAPDGRRLVTLGQGPQALVWDLTGLGSAAPKPAKLSDKELAALWDNLGAGDAAKAHTAMCKLWASPAQAVTLLKDKLKPTAPLSDEDVEKLIKQLNDPKFAIRAKANDMLTQLGESARPHLQKALAAKPALEIKTRVEKLLADIAAGKTAGRELVELRAVEVLEVLNTPAARGLIESLSRGGGGRFTSEARYALLRLAQRPAGKE